MMRRRRRQQGGCKQAGEQEVPQVIRAELELEAVRRTAEGDRHDAGVVDQQMQAIMRREKLARESAHAPSPSRGRPMHP
jgi:hypothetical protein